MAAATRPLGWGLEAIAPDSGEVPHLGVAAGDGEAPALRSRDGAVQAAA